MAALRYTRQVRLADVGPSGQERLGGLHAHVPGDDLAARVEALYLAGAGAAVEAEHEAIAEAARGLNPEVEIVAVAVAVAVHVNDHVNDHGDGDVDVDVVVDGDGLQGGPREVAAGAMRALLKLRAALEET